MSNIHKDVLNSILQSPQVFGVYYFYSIDGKPIYIGKAKNLYKRLISYIKDDVSVKTRAMLSHAKSLQWVVCGNESEALLLEAKQIRLYQPKYNILLKDDKFFPEIFIGVSSQYPAISISKSRQSVDGLRFGPFANYKTAKGIFDIMQKVCKIRDCKDSFFNQRKLPCLHYYIGRCSAPCVGMVNETEYGNQIKMAKDILSGKNKQLVREFKSKMLLCSKNLQYEEAAKFRDLIGFLDGISFKDGDIQIDGSCDAIALFQKDGKLCVHIVFIRNGNNYGQFSMFPKSRLDIDLEGALESCIMQFYTDNEPPMEILVNIDLQNKASLERVILESYGYAVKVINPKSGNKKRLMDFVEINAKDAIIRQSNKLDKIEENMQSLAQLLSIEGKIRRIEIFDNSHLFGSNAVGGMVVFGKIGFMKKYYRRYNFYNLLNGGGDDYDMMRQMLLRRLNTIKNTLEVYNDCDLVANESNEVLMPDIWLVDGGESHKNVVWSVMQEAGVVIPFVCVAKGPNRNAGDETLHLYNQDAPVKLEKGSDLLFFIQNLRDEAHRFAITSHRKKRDSSMFDKKANKSKDKRAK